MIQTILEKSTNTHVLHSTKAVEPKQLPNSGMQFKVDSGHVVHGEHGVIGVSGNVCKFNQKELNPVTQKMQNAFD